MTLLQDPWGKYLWPEWQGRDGCRTPIPWEADKPHAGFSTAGTTWLPVPDTHKDKAVSLQEQDQNSILTFARAFLKWRKDHPALVTGDIDFMDAEQDSVLMFTRTLGSQTIFCAFNLNGNESTVTVSLTLTPDTDSLPCKTGQLQDNTLHLPGFGLFFGQV